MKKEKERLRKRKKRSEPGHWGMNTVVSCLNGIGEFLVLINRYTRKEIRTRETVINGIHKQSLNGLTASQFAAQFTLSA